MAKIEHIKNKQHEIVYPVTKIAGVYDNNGVPLATTLAAIAETANNAYVKPDTGIPTTDIIDPTLGLTQAQINQLIITGNIVVNLTASPLSMFVGEQKTINLSATVNTAATSITIKRDGTAIATGTGTSLTASDPITPVAAGTVTYTAEFVVAGSTKTAAKSVAVVYPIYIGSGASYVQGTALTTPKTSPAGTYNVTVAANGDHVYFNVPSTMTIHGATMGGFEFPLDAPVNKTINGVSYKSYGSSNTYDAGTLTIIIS